MTYTERVLLLLTSRPGEWFDGMALSHVAGCYAWRTRVSEARHIVRSEGAGDIVNVQTTLPDGSKRSLYRFEPTVRFPV